MKVCLISNQIAAWGKIGGFGTATRELGRGLVENGIEVAAVVLRRPRYGQKAVENLDGITVHGLSSLEILISGRIFKQIDADIYHSQEPTISSYYAQRIMPNRLHVVTCRDPRSWIDHLIELKYTNLKKRLLAPVTQYYEAGPMVRRAVQKADHVLSPAPTALHERIKFLYGDSVEPHFMPYPVDLPDQEIQKSKKPYVLFVGRFDHRKRIERFFQLVEKFPDIHFVAVGRAHDEAYGRQLRQCYGQLPNFEMVGFVDRFGERNMSDYYEKAWILVNTSAREGLPYTFLEAAAFGVAILSCNNPDDFASRFGYFAQNDDFEKGLQYLLTDDQWLAKGRSGAKYVAGIWSRQESIARHMHLYQQLLTGKK